MPVSCHLWRSWEALLAQPGPQPSAAVANLSSRHFSATPLGTRIFFHLLRLIKISKNHMALPGALGEQAVIAAHQLSCLRHAGFSQARD